MFNIDLLTGLYKEWKIDDWRICLRENMNYFVNKIKSNPLYWLLLMKWLVEDFKSEYFLLLDEALQKINYNLSPKQHTRYLYYTWLWCIKKFLATYLNNNLSCWRWSLRIIDCEFKADWADMEVEWITDFEQDFLRTMLDEVMCKTLTHEEQVVCNMRFLCDKKHSQDLVAKKLWCPKWKIARMEKKIFERIRLYLENDDQWQKNVLSAEENQKSDLTCADDVIENELTLDTTINSSLTDIQN